jgi:subtilisin family serine protease
MKRLIVLASLILAATSSIAAETQRYLISTKSATRTTALRRLAANAADASKHRVRAFRNFNAFAADLTAEEVAELRKSGDVESIELVPERHIFGMTERPSVLPIETNAIRYNLQQIVPWGVPVIHAPAVWEVTKGSADVNVAVIDTGIDYTHPDIAPAYAGGYNAIDPTKSDIDDHYHGTHVAGTIAAADNQFGVIGIAPNVNLWSVKVLDRRGRGTAETVSDGIDWVISKAKEVGGRWVINMSLGSKLGARVEGIAVARALEANIVVVAATGNTSLPQLSYPAAYEGVIAVGATDANSGLAGFSTWGPGMSLVAPGVAVISTYRTGSVFTADVANANVLVDGVGITGSPFGEVSGKLVDCGLGYPEDFPVTVRGRVALIKRGEIPFREKARNALQAGATAVVVYNVPGMTTDINAWTMLIQECNQGVCSVPDEWKDFPFPLTIGVSVEDGQKLRAWLNKNVNVGFREEDYGPMSGTSMATPHVAGAAALLLSLAPDLNTAQVALALEKTATDLYEAGWDLRTAWGMLDIEAAARYVAPGAFGLPASNPVPPSKRRSGRQ